MKSAEWFGMDRSSAFGTDLGARHRPRRPVRSSLARRSAVRATFGALLVLGIGAPAAAAGINGLTAGGPGADAAVVGSCDSDGIRADYQTGLNARGRPTVTAVTLSGIHPSCNGSTVHVTISGADGGALSTGVSPVLGTVQTVAMATPADVTSVGGTAVVVTG